jgi:hypothetical protein
MAGVIYQIAERANRTNVQTGARRDGSAVGFVAQQGPVRTAEQRKQAGRLGPPRVHRRIRRPVASLQTMTLGGLQR